MIEAEAYVVHSYFGDLNLISEAQNLFYLFIYFFKFWSTSLVLIE